MTSLSAEAGISFRSKLLLVRSKDLLERSCPRCNSGLHSPDRSPSDSGTESWARSHPAQVCWVHHISEPDFLLPHVSHQPWPQVRPTSAVQGLPGTGALSGLLSTLEKGGPVLRLQRPSNEQPCSCKEEHSFALRLPLAGAPLHSSLLRSKQSSP